MCIPGITSENTPFATCSTDSDCTTNAKSLTGQDMYGRCICGYSDNGSQYCTTFPGDEVSVRAIKQFTKAVSAGVLSNCNINADNTACIAAHWDSANVVKFEYYYFLMEDGPYIAGADSCTFEIVAPVEYAWEQEVNAMGTATILVASMALVLLP